MSSSEFSNDEYDYENYSFRYDEEDQASRSRPYHLISTRARLLAAAAQNDVETLKQLLDSPKWYNVKDESGLNLLQIAILKESDEVFDYLLSLDDFPLEAVDDEGATALVVALSYYDGDSEDWMGDRYAYELIKKGADIDKKCREGDSLLHCALIRGFVRVARLLLERGADVNMLNEEGETPLHVCFHGFSYTAVAELTEAITMLLCYGADPSIRRNDGDSVLDIIMADCVRDGILVAQENVFYFTIDEWSSYKIPGGTLMQLAQDRSPLFHQVIKFTLEIIRKEHFDLHREYLRELAQHRSPLFHQSIEYTFEMIREERSDLYLYSLFLFTIDSEYLGILLEKYPYFVKDLLQSHSIISFWHVKFRNYAFNLKNFDMLMQSSFDSNTIELISKLDSSNIIPFILSSEKNIEESMGIIYYLLSYGMTLHEIDLENIYKKTVYSEDFKNLLFMDVEKQFDKQITEFMPRLIYDVTLDIHKSVEDPSLCRFIDWEQIFSYFVHPKIQNAYYQIESNEVIERELPQVPLLLELARDAFRKHFVKTFKITAAKQFYSLLKSLPISSVHEKILTFESKLY